MAEEREQLSARAADLLARARRGEIVCTPFLTPAEQLWLQRHAGAAKGELLFAGGYDAAERRRAFFLPDYARDENGEPIPELLTDAFAENLAALEIAGSGYRALSHRDFLGAALNLGIRRDAVGDVAVLSPERAVLFCDRVIADFLTQNLTRVANDAVRVSPFVPPAGFDGGRRFRQIADTVPSPRADAVVAALTSLSRERAQALFRAGAVEIDYEPCDKPDRPVNEGAVLTVRGYGKFVVRTLSDKTKKGRFRLGADQYL